jgi:subfamily B ATP-binding cassette protein HlyB/CyaB
VVLQESFLFNLSVKDIICIHHPAANMTDIVKVAMVAGAHESILELPKVMILW